MRSRRSLKVSHTQTSKTKLVNSTNPFYEGLYGLLKFVMKCHMNTVNILMANYNAYWM